MSENKFDILMAHYLVVMEAYHNLAKATAHGLHTNPIDSCPAITCKFNREFLTKLFSEEPDASKEPRS